MTFSFSSIPQNTHRLLMTVELRPEQGDRFQPTGFPHLGPALYELHDGTEMLLVESAQSMANRMEAVCWDAGKDNVIDELQGLPYVKIDLKGYGTTSSILEFHRLNSPYIWQGGTDDAGTKFREEFGRSLGMDRLTAGMKKGKQKGEALTEEGRTVPGVLDMRRLAQAAFRYDPNSIIHGVFLENIDGRLRLARVLSGFIEARNVKSVASGGVKFDRVFPAQETIEKVLLKSNDGYTNVPFTRTEFTAERITAYFSLDVSLLRSYGLADEALDLLIIFSLFKVQRLLSSSLRLRTACSLMATEQLRVTNAQDLVVPSESELSGAVRSALEKCRAASLFSDPPVTHMTWSPKS